MNDPPEPCPRCGLPPRECKALSDQQWAEAATVDPATGDIIYRTYGSDNDDDATHDEDVHDLP